MIFPFVFLMASSARALLADAPQGVSAWLVASHGCPILTERRNLIICESIQCLVEAKPVSSVGDLVAAAVHHLHMSESKSLVKMQNTVELCIRSGHSQFSFSSVSLLAPAYTLMIAGSSCKRKFFASHSGYRHRTKE
jgi:hypothetical protein